MPTVLILGATSDMAVSIARKFASAGYDIQLAGRDTAKLEPLQKDLTIRFSIRCSTHSFDAANVDNHENFLAKLPGLPETTICVFGYLGDQHLAETSWTESNKIIQTNYTGAVSILNLVANAYVEAKKGMIIGISSVAGERGRQSNYLYGSAKAGFTAYLSGLRNRLFQQGIHVLTVKPGFVYTRMTEGLTLPPLLTATPEEVAGRIYSAALKKKDLIYVKWFWRWIMLIIRNIPEPIFKKLKL